MKHRNDNIRIGLRQSRKMPLWTTPELWEQHAELEVTSATRARYSVLRPRIACGNAGARAKAKGNRSARALFVLYDVIV